MSRRVKLVFAVIGSLILSIMLTVATQFIASNHFTKDSFVLDKWHVYVNDNDYGEVSLKDTVLERTVRGDSIDMYTVLPANLDDGYTLRLLVYLCSIEVELDGEPIYDYGVELVKNNKMVGSGYHFITLPRNVEGKTIHIHLVLNERDAFTSFSDIVCNKSVEAKTSLADTQIINIFIGCFLYMIGVSAIFICLFAICVDREYFKLLLIGIFSFFMGRWSLLNAKAFQLFSTELLYNTVNEYIMLYLAPIPFMTLMWISRKDRDIANWRKVALKGVTIVFSMFFVIATILHFTNIVRYPAILFVFHIIGAIGLLVVLVAGFINSKAQNSSDRIILIGLYVLVLSIALDLVRFNVQKFFLPNSQALLFSVIPVGTMIFVIILIVSYLHGLYTIILTKAEQDVLTDLAYKDVLSELSNRAMCKKDFAEIEEKKFDYAIINFDLNGLKKVNDKFGHDEGDNLIKAFSSILQSAFGKIGKCYRMGGDEFLVLVVGAGKTEIDNALKNFEKAEEEESCRKAYRIFASYGYAFGNEVEGAMTSKCYSLADSRMYEMKQHHEHRE